MIPGVDDGAEDPTEEPSSNYTLTCADPEDAEKTLSITLSDMKVDKSLTSASVNTDAIIVSAKVVSDLQQDIYFVGEYTNNITSSANKYQVVVTAYPNGLEGSTAIKTVDKSSKAYPDYLVDKATATVAANGENTVTKEGKLYFTVADDFEWSKVTVKLEVFKIVKNQTADSKQLIITKKFDFSK